METIRPEISRREFLKIFGLAAALLIPGCGQEDDSLVIYPTTIPTDTVIPTETPVATNTVIPTETPVATNTVIPTETPVPIYSAETLKRLVSPEEAEFLATHRIRSGDPSKPNILITYDDGDRNDEVDQIIEAYDARSVKCTFFFRGDCLERCKDSIRRAIKSGHEVGCHAYYHEILLTKMSASKVEKQLEDWVNEFSQIVPGYRVKMWRAPFGAWNNKVLEVAASFGMQHVAWNVESGGVDPKTVEIVLKNYDIVSNRLHTKNGLIVLSHAQRYYDIKKAPEIVDEFLKLGLTPVTMSEGMRPKNKWNGVV